MVYTQGFLIISPIGPDHWYKWWLYKIIACQHRPAEWVVKDRPLNQVVYLAPCKLMRYSAILYRYNICDQCSLIRVGLIYYWPE